MRPDQRYSLSTALLDDQERFVIVDPDDVVHVASSWLQFLTDSGRSPNTVKAYGLRVAEYLTWTSLTKDWRSVTLSHLVLWRRIVALRPSQKSTGSPQVTDATVSLWIAPLRSFYEWADGEGLLTTDVANRMTHSKYFAPGTPAGGEFGRRRRVLVPELKPSRLSEQKQPKWIDDSRARHELETLNLNVRDRFLIDLLYFTGVRIGEALSLFRSDMHFAGGSRELGCTETSPHFHVREDNPVENRAEVKGRPRLLHVSDDLVEKYIDLMLERHRLLGGEERGEDGSPHVFVNMYSRDASRGRAMSYYGAKKLMTRCSARIGFDLSGPHTLRHTLATRLVRGIDCEPQGLDVVQSILGHASISSTMIYTHDLEAAKKAALDSIAARTVNLGAES